MSDELDALRAERELLLRQRDELRRDKDNAERRVAELWRDIEAASSSERDELGALLEALTEEVDAITAELGAARRAGEGARARLQRERDDFGAQLEAARREADIARVRLEEERARLESALDAAHEERDAARRTAEGSNEKLKQALKQLVDAYDVRVERDELRRVKEALEARLERVAVASPPAEAGRGALRVVHGSGPRASALPPARPSPEAAIRLEGVGGPETGDDDDREDSAPPWRAFLDPSDNPEG